MKNKEITIYELMGLIKDRKAPKKIKLQDRTYEYDKNYETYFDIKNQENLLCYVMVRNDLNCTVEILPKENDEWEDIYTLNDTEEHHFMNRQNGMTQEDRRLLDSNFKTLGETINQLIKNQKYLKERLDKNEK